MKRIKRCSYPVIALLIILLAFDISFTFEKNRFFVISDPLISIPRQKDIADGFKLGLKTQTPTDNTVAEINKIPDVKFVLAAGTGSSRDPGRDQKYLDFDESPSTLKGEAMFKAATNQ